MKTALTLLLFAIAPQMAMPAEITRIWLTHKSNDPSKIVVNWMTDEPGDSVVRFGLTADVSSGQIGRRFRGGWG